MTAPPIDIVGLGEALIEFSQIPGGNTWRQGFGGDTSNFVIAASRTGARCAYLSRVGNEDFGRALLELWRREGVDCSAVESDDSAGTGLYFISYGPKGHSFSYRRSGSAATRMCLSEGFRGQLSQSRWLHISGISQAISEQACDTVFEAIEAACERRIPYSYDLNWRSRLWPAPRAAAVARASIARCQLFLPSIDEAAALFGLADPRRLIDWALELGARTVAVKCGERGVVIGDGKTIIEIGAHRVNAVDATGAGDCFGGVTVARLLAGDTLERAARAGCVAAALAATGYGAIDPLPRWPDIERILAMGR